MSELKLTGTYIDIVFDGPPDHESGRFVEVENHEGEGMNFGDWVEREDGLWALRFDDGIGFYQAQLAERDKRVKELETTILSLGEVAHLNQSQLAKRDDSLCQIFEIANNVVTHLGVNINRDEELAKIAEIASKGGER